MKEIPEEKICLVLYIADHPSENEVNLDFFSFL